MRIRKSLPNIVTLGNLFLGYFAIVMATQGRFNFAAWLIFCATFLDGLDGLTARLTNQSSEFGAELDSFSDVISFGLAPSILIYQSSLQHYGFTGLLFGFMLVAASVIRLVKFNISHSGKPYLVGLVVPASALLLVSFHFYASYYHSALITGPLYFGLITICSIMMLTNIPYRRVPVIPLYGNRHQILCWFSLLVIMGLLIWKPKLMLLPFMIIYLLTGPVEWLVVYLRKLGKPENYAGEGNRL
ncbi:MAG: CDP-diacylglycerol--serine O-phosphatidyltransferase [Calditrichaeota bacterium]|nr:CDP-diacylglycerol--serine O-phosphatidyltransferase [Calditrichota bacterium]MBT7615694.1 CDP-diacylglycerol--serine O-phosphatidyltransferase [Calditrichota bacterium]MBT7788333.1 CDP-diacylglycerol--serine O-phosphatidyltransferase [Calditrichota bacterium]